MLSFALFIQLILAASVPTVVTFEDGSFDVAIVFENKSARSHLNAQIALMLAAKKHCGKKSTAVSDGAITLNNAPLFAATDRLWS